MFGHWQTHDEYLTFTQQGLKKIPLEFQEEYQLSFQQFQLLNLDSVEDIIRPLYSHTGRAAKNQSQLFRALLLAANRKLTLNQLPRMLKTSPMLRLIAGISKEELPGIASFYDFIARIIPINEKSQLRSVSIKPKTKLKKGHKLPNKRKNLSHKIAAIAREKELCPFRPERFIQQIFQAVSLSFSTEIGLLEDSLTLSGDGTCLLTGACPKGRKVCTCQSKGIYRCDCPRRHSDPSASWGWDSHNEHYFYGYTAFLLATYDKKSKADLPLYIRLVDAKRHDSISALFCLSEFKSMNPTRKITRFSADSACDNWATYSLLSEWQIEPFIPLRKNNVGHKKYPAISANSQGIPICEANLPMKFDGHSTDRNRNKWRCPFAVKKEFEKCPLGQNCSQSSYGRTKYTQPADDPRLFTKVPRNTKKWTKIYNERSGCERLNKQLLIDYKIEQSKIRGKKQYYLALIAAGMDIHLKAQYAFLSR